MIPDAAQLVLAAFVVFCRVGGALMLMPGFSSARIPMQTRVLVAVGLSLATTPLLQDDVGKALTDSAPTTLMRVMAAEILTGVTIGLLGRCFFIALEAIGVAISMAVGLSSNLGAPVDEDEPLPAIATLLSLAATTLIFLSDQHLEIVRALAASYGSLPVHDGFSAQFAIGQIGAKVALAFTLALRLGSPFLILSVILNFAVGLTNRLVPTVQVFFLSSPFLLIGGLLLLYVSVRPFLQLFLDAFGHFLVTG